MKKVILVTLIILFASGSFAYSETNDFGKMISNVLSSVIDSTGQKTKFGKIDSVLPREVPKDITRFTLEVGYFAIEIYFPLYNGDSKSYSWSTYNSTYSYSEISYHGINSYLEYDSLDGSKAYYGYSGDELLLYGGEADGLDFHFNTPLAVINNSILNNEGTIQSSTTFDVEGYNCFITYEGSVAKIGDVTVPAGTFSDCLSLSMEFTYQVEGESGSFNVKDVWILAPNVGKLKIAAMDPFFNLLGWMELTGGTVGGVDVSDLGNSLTPDGYEVADHLRIGAVINTEEKGQIEAVWQKGGEDITDRGDMVIWGHFYASPSDVTWGSENNPDLFVKIWFDASGRVDVNFFHVSVPNIKVYSDYPEDGAYNEFGTTTMDRRYIRHEYYPEGGSSYFENYENGLPAGGYSQTGNPYGNYTINNLVIGSVINTVEKGPIDAVWRFGGQDNTSRGDQVVWGHFYASPSDVTWGSENNPDLFVKIWFDVNGRVDVNFFHVSVPDIEVYSDLPDDGTYDQKGTTIMDNRYIRHEYWR